MLYAARVLGPDGTQYNYCWEADTFKDFVKQVRKEIPKQCRIVSVSEVTYEEDPQYDERVSPPGTAETPSTHLCGCGKPVRYIVPGGDGTANACNKYGRCPTWDQLRDDYSRLYAAAKAFADAATDDIARMREHFGQ